MKNNKLIIGLLSLLIISSIVLTGSFWKVKEFNGATKIDGPAWTYNIYSFSEGQVYCAAYTRGPARRIPYSSYEYYNSYGSEWTNNGTYVADGSYTKKLVSTGISGACGRFLIFPFDDGRAILIGIALP